MRRPIVTTSIAAFTLFLGLACGILVRPALFPFTVDVLNKTPILEGVPDIQQSTAYSCGAAALQAVLSFWGIDKCERPLMDALHTNELTGTSPENIIRVAREMGLEAYPRENLDLKDLKETVSRIPVICAIQAWPSSPGAGFSWDKCWEDGHYVIVIGVDKKNVYVEDPSLLGTRGFIPREEFLERWHDYTGAPPFDKSDRAYLHLGIFIIGKTRAEQPVFTHVE